MISMDTETTGLSFYKGARPYMVVCCDGSDNFIWEGQVNPYTREVFWDDEVLDEIKKKIEQEDEIVFHNAQFDVRALASIGIEIPWEKIHDTQIASHIISSGDRHGLEYLAVKYFGYWNDHEETIRENVMAERRKHPEYKLATPENFDYISDTKWWKMDMWLDLENTRKYALVDVESTYLLWLAFKKELKKSGWWDLYLLRRSLLPICYDITETGLQIDTEAMRKEIESIEKEIEEIRKKIEKEANFRVRFEFDKKSHIISLIKMDKDIKLPFKTEKGNISTSEATLKYYEKTTDNKLISDLLRARKLRTKVRFLKSYLAWADEKGRIHSTLNITGTRETRQSSSDPNQQNISKEVRHLFGPPPGKLWAEIDFANIELRIWAYSTKNKKLIEAFEKGTSVHLEIMKVIYPNVYKQHIKEPTTETQKIYRDVKSGNFALIYGATEKKADETYGRPGATALVYKNFPGIKEFMESKRLECEKNLEELGRFCVITICGYPLDVPPEDPYKATNFYIQGSAGMFMAKAMLAVTKLPRYIDSGAKICSQVHDSLTIEIPIHSSILKTIESIKSAMEYCVAHEFGKTPVDVQIKIRKEDYSEELFENFVKRNHGNFYILEREE